MKRAIAALILGLLPVPAAAADPLRDLVPLIEVFGGGGPIPGYDVVGARCAGLLYAQDQWRQQHGGEGPRQGQLDAAATALEASVQQRVNDGQSLTDATLSLERDLRRLISLYGERFARNAMAGHPWRNDPDLKGDQAYCTAALR